MALAVDAVSSSENSAQTSLTWAHTCTGSNRLLLVGIVFYRNSNSAIDDVTYNGVSMDEVPSSTTNNGEYFVAVYSLVAPATGSNNIVVSMSGSAPFELSAGGISFTDAHQTVPLGTANTATGTSSAPSVTISSGTDQIVFANLAMLHNGTLSVGALQTSRWNDIGASGFLKYAGSTEPGDASTTMSWSNTTSQAWAITGVPVKPTTVASAGTGSLLLLGVG
jgi:hypothetical protein